jgi:translation elongation factor EF-Tu-like GTPase
MFTKHRVTVFRSYSDIDSNIEERNRGILLMRHILNMKLKKDIILILIAQSSAIYKKYADWCYSDGGCYFGGAVNDGPQVQTREHVILAKEVGISHMLSI